MTLSAGVRPLGCSKSSFRYHLNLNPKYQENKPSWKLNNKGYLIDNINCKYKNQNHYFEVSSSGENH